MQPSDLVLRRDDLTVFGRSLVERLDVVEEISPWGDPISERTWLIAVDNGADVQAIEVMDDYTPDEGPVYIYVPLAHGPVQERAHVR